MFFFSSLFFVKVFFCIVAFVCTCNSAVVIIGCDGLGSSYINFDDTYRIKKAFFEEGAYTEACRCVRVSETAPNWAAHFLGSEPEITGIVSDDVTIPSVFGNEPYPSLFKETEKLNKSGLLLYDDITGIDFLKETEISRVLKAENSSSMLSIFEQLILSSGLPDLTFVRYRNTERVGIRNGWGGPSHENSIYEFDMWCGELFDILERSNLWKFIHVMLISNHAGCQRDSLARHCWAVPWAIRGPGIMAHKLPGIVRITQTAPTVLRILGGDIPSVWTGTPIDLTNTNTEKRYMVVAGKVRSKYDNYTILKMSFLIPIAYVIGFCVIACIYEMWRRSRKNKNVQEFTCKEVKIN